MNHEMGEELHAVVKARDAALRRHRDLLAQLHGGVGRLVSARQNLRLAGDALAALYAVSSLSMEDAGHGAAPLAQAQAQGNVRALPAGRLDSSDAQLQRAVRPAVKADVEDQGNGGVWREVGSHGDEGQVDRHR
jgi:hypothetical protein